MPGRIDSLLKEGSWPVPAIFGLIQEAGGVSDAEMKKAFNMGIGFVVATPADEAKKAISALGRAGYASYLIGRTVKGAGQVRYQ